VIDSVRRRLWLVAYVLATFLSFPHPLSLAGGPAGSVLDLGLLVSFAVAPCLVFGLAGRAPRGAALSALGWTVIAHGAVLHFIFVVTVSYGRAPVLVGFLAPLALATYAALLAALFGGGWSWLSGRGRANAWTAALLWTALDHLRGHLFTGWPWATLGYAQHLNPALMGLPQWTGVYGLSFAVVLGGVGAAEAIVSLRAGRRPRVSTLLALGLVLVLHGIGFVTRIPAPDDLGLAGTVPVESVRIALIQGNIEQGVKWDREFAGRTLEIYERLSRAAAADGAEIVVWPETALPGAIELDAAVQSRMEALARETGALLVVGSVGIDLTEAGQVGSFYDSAFFVDPVRGLDGARYDKSHLVPFGEYVPFRSLVGSFLGAVASGIASGDVTPGEGPRAIDLALPGRAGRAPRTVRVGVPICYELLFPDLVRRFVADGGGILLGITNDAWYGRTGAPYQFLAMTAMRSAETGVYGVRAANTGVSAVIDSGGRVRQRTPIFEEAWLAAEVPIRPARPGGSFYVRHGDLFAWACWIGLLGAALPRAWKREEGS
jgi:apolipoprotein N-acyltransferase